MKDGLYTAHDGVLIMRFYAVYNVNEIGALRWIDSYWLSYEKAVERFKKLWIFCREPDEDEIKHYVKCMKTED